MQINTTKYILEVFTLLKKGLFLFMLVLLSISLIACGGDGDSSTNNNDANDSEQAEQTEDKKLGIGDTAEVGNIKFTLKNVSLTDERNEFAEQDPKMVVKIEYELENGTDEEIPVGGDLEVYDATGNKMESYPLDNTLGSLKPGKKIQGVEHFGIEEGPIEIYFQPMLSFDEPAVFEVDVK